MFAWILRFTRKKYRKIYGLQVNIINYFLSIYFFSNLCVIIKTSINTKYGLVRRPQFILLCIVCFHLRLRINLFLVFTKTYKKTFQNRLKSLDSNKKVEMAIKNKEIWNFSNEWSRRIHCWKFEISIYPIIFYASK